VRTTTDRVAVRTVLPRSCGRVCDPRPHLCAPFC